MLRCACEVLTPALIEEGRPLLAFNWIESGSFDPAIALDPDFDLYLAAQRLNRLKVFTLRKEATLVGYIVYTVGHSLHHRGMKIGHGEAFYVADACREAAAQLWDFAEAALKTAGVQRVGWFVVEGSRAYNFLLKRGCARDEVVMEKVLA